MGSYVKKGDLEDEQFVQKEVLRKILTKNNMTQ